MIPWYLINQEGGGFDIFWLLLPVLCCLLMMGQRGEKAPERATLTESWYTSQEIEISYNAIENETSEWMKEAEARKERSESILTRIRGVFGARADYTFTVREANPPRLYELRYGNNPVFFELTEVEGGGTVVKATYNSEIKSRMAKFKAKLPLKVPATPIGDRCQACGKPVLKEFVLCPYCGEKLIKE